MTIVSSVKLDATDAGGEPRWGMWTSMVTAWVLPATTATRTQHLPLGRAFVAHLLAAALVPILVVILTVSVNSYSMNISDISTALLEVFGFVVLDLQRDLSGIVLSLLGYGLTIEVGFLALAVLVMPWGARDERIGATLRHAVRRVWLQSTHVIPIVLLVGSVAIALDGADRAWSWEHPSPGWSLGHPMTPGLPPSDPGYADAQREFEAAVKQYNRKYRKHRQELAAWFRTVPWWYLGYQGDKIASFALMASLWGLWALVRALGADRTVLPIVRAPTCEQCGYSLTGMPMEDRCPECGEPVGESLGPDARSGTIWERRSEIGRLRAWWRCFLGTFLQPGRFGRQLRVVSPATDYRNFFALHLPLIFCFGTAGLMACGLAMMTLGISITELIVMLELTPELVLLAAGMTYGCLSVIAAVLLAGLAALLGSGWHGFRARRNLMPGAIQLACYLSGYLTLCYVFAAGSAAAVVTLQNGSFYADWAQGMRIDDVTLAFYSWFVPNMLCLFVYFVLVVRGTAATRYANR